MSKGPGKIERAIENAFGAEGKAYTVQDLFSLAYPEAKSLARKHRVAIKRAAVAVCNRTGWTYLSDDRRGRGLIYYNPVDVMSYAMARKKGDMFSLYQRRGSWIRLQSEREIEAKLEKGGKDHDLITEGGVWWEDVQREIAKREGDDETYQRLVQKRNSSLAQWAAAFKKVA